jgi:parallel beta-helix repeat protein
MTYGSNGIYLNCSNNNIIADNEILYNTGFGIHPQLSSGNMIQHNNFIGNGKSVETHQIHDNIWDSDYPSGGNYWSDHESADFYSGPHQDQIGNDCICDIPYILDAGNRDHYPLYVPLRFVFLSVEPRYVVDIPINGSFNIDVTVFNVGNLHGWQFELHYDPTLLSAIDVVEGPFLSDIAETVFLRRIYNSEGYMLIAATFFPPYPVEGAQGIGTLATVTFKVKSEGQSKLELNENKTKLYRVLWGNNVPIEYLKRDGYFTNQAISCSIDIEPSTLNLKSNGKWITIFIQLPAEYEPKYIDASSIFLNGAIQPVSDQEQGFAADPNEYLVDHDGDGILELMIKFDRAAVKSFILSQDPARVITLVFTGKLLYGLPIQGEDTLSIIPETRRKL